MRDTELYRYLLGLDVPWTIARVQLDVKQHRVDVWAEHPRGARWPCPECGSELATYDHADERRWRHMDSCQFKTYLHARPPRVQCPKHGVKQVRLPWAEPNSRFTSMFERLVIDVLKETDVLGAARILDVSWDEAWGVMERAVARGMMAKQRRVVENLGIDEKAAAKGHKYITLVCDLDTATVEYIGDERKTETLDNYYRTLNKEQLTSIKAVAMDMWEPYINSTMAHVPDAESKIVFDRFHIMQHMGKAVDVVRKQEHRALRAEGDERLTGTKYIWLYSQENLPEHHMDRFKQLRATDLKTARAWAIKETLRHLWTYRRLGWAERHWRQWYFWATHSRLKPVVQAARTIERHLQNVMTFFAHRVTNAVSEGINSKIQTIKKRACGYRNRDNFKTAIYFYCGGLQLYPLQATHSLAG